jgi:hypothetical protein
MSGPLLNGKLCPSSEGVAVASEALQQLYFDLGAIEQSPLTALLQPGGNSTKVPIGKGRPFTLPEAVERELRHLLVRKTCVWDGRQWTPDDSQPLPAKSEQQLPKPIDLHDLLAANLATPRELIEGILHQGSKMVIGGGSKSFKTWNLLDLALSVAAGVPWWEFATTKGRVLYINFELQDAFFNSRVKSLLTEKECTVDETQFMYWGLRGHAAAFKNLKAEILAATNLPDLTLIVVDPIYKGLGDRDENKAGDIASLLNEIESLAVATGAAVVFGHHFSKGNQAGKEAIDRVSGSGVFARDPDTILTMTRHKDEDAYVVDTILRNFPPIEPFVVRWGHPLMMRDRKLDPKDLKKANAPQEKYSDEQILASLDSREMTTTEWQKDAGNRIGISSSGFNIRRRRLEKDGLITQNGKKWRRVSK